MKTIETTAYPFLNRWTRPSCYAGAQWPDYYRSGIGQSRDSKPLERANFDAMLKALGGERNHDTETVYQDRVLTRDDEPTPLPLVKIVRECHWAVGWVEWIAIHETATDALEIANLIMESFEDYPVIDETLWSEYEDDEAQQLWKDCSATFRLEYVREHRSEFEFRNLADMLGCLRGNYFAGYASELVG